MGIEDGKLARVERVEGAGESCWYIRIGKEGVFGGEYIDEGIAQKAADDINAAVSPLLTAAETRGELRGLERAAEIAGSWGRDRERSYEFPTGEISKEIRSLSASIRGKAGEGL